MTSIKAFFLGKSNKILGKFSKKPFAFKLFITLILFSLIPLLIVGVLGISASRYSAIENSRQSLSTQASLTAALYDILLGERLQDIRQLANNGVVRRFSETWPEPSLEDETETQNILNDLVQANTYFQQIILMDLQGEIILSVNDKFGLNLETQIIILEGIAGNDFISDIVLATDDQSQSILYSTPVFDKDGTVVLIALLVVHVDELWDLLDNHTKSFGQEYEGILTDEFGLILYNSINEDLDLNTPLKFNSESGSMHISEGVVSLQIESSESNFLSFLSEDQRKNPDQPNLIYQSDGENIPYYAETAQLNIKPWVVVESIPEAILLAPVVRLSWTFVGIIFFIGILIIPLTKIATFKNAAPLKEITKAVERLTNGELDQPISSVIGVTDDETEVLLNSLDTMRESLRDSYTGLETRNQRMSRLSDLAVSLSGSVIDISIQIVTFITELLEVEVATVEEFRGENISILAMHRHGQILLGGEFPFRGTPCENIRAEKKICLHSQAVTDFPEDSFLAEFGLNTYMGVPILDSNGEVIGVINAMDDKPRDFDEGDIHLLQIMAKRVGVELERTHAEAQIRRRVGELEAIAEVSELVTTGGNLQPILDDLTRMIVKVTDFDGVGISLFQSEEGYITFPAVYTNGQEIRFLKQRQGTQKEMKDLPAVQQLIDGDKYVLVDSPTSDLRVDKKQRKLAREDGIETLLIWPLQHSGKIIGTLDLVSGEQIDITAKDLKLYSTLADQTANAIQNASLLTETEQRLNETSILYDLSSSLASNFRKEEMLPIILDHIQDSLEIEGSSILMLESKTGEISVKATRGSFDKIEDILLPSENMPSYCALISGEPCIGRHNCPFWPNDLPPSKTICIPFKVGDKIIGGLNLGINLSSELLEDHHRLLNGIADIAANALRRAMLFEEVQLYKDTFDSTTDAIMITDLESNIIDINPAFERVTGFTKEETLGKKPSLIKSEHGDSKFYEKMWQQILKEGFWAGEIINTNKDEIEWNSFLTISTVKDENDQPIAYVGINRDITETKKLQLDLEDSYLTTIEALASALDARDRETEGHSTRVAASAMQVAEMMDLSPTSRQALLHGALLHDLGKIGVSDTILHKPGPLTEEEWVVMKHHPEIGYTILHSVKFLYDALPVILYHHEKWDGSGYPKGLSGEEIPLIARIFTVTDAYDAMTSDRPYRNAASHSDALYEIEQSAGIYFDPHVTAAFLKLHGRG
ncbi:MAG: GAF domain-containing protein [Chloroflexi bacterium]|nr:GAF domain-containing protein [Chloroflexota bacterium]